MTNAISQAPRFWRVQLWEICFLAIVGLLLTDALLWPASYAASADQTAFLVSVSVMLLQSVAARKNPGGMSAYQAGLRWPAAGILASITLTAWRFDADAGAVVGGVCTCLWLFNEVRSWRRSRASGKAMS